MRDLLSDEFRVDVVSNGSVCGCHFADGALRHGQNGYERIAKLNSQRSDSRRKPGHKIRRRMADTRQNIRLLSKMDRCCRWSEGKSNAPASSLELPRQGYPVSLSCFSLSIATAKDVSAITSCRKPVKRTDRHRSSVERPDRHRRLHHVAIADISVSVPSRAL